MGYTFGAGGPSASISASRDKMNSDYQSVQEQSGIFASSGGFDVTVGNHTQLNGGVIASTATADHNRLDTGTLGFSDIHNQADFRTEHQGAGISTGGSIGGQFAGNMANTLLAGGNISPIFDKEKEQRRLQEAQLIREIGSQAMDIARTEGKIAGEKAKKDPAALQAAREQLAGQGNLNPTDKQIADQAYNTAMAPYGTGSSLQRGMQAATAVIQGLAGGDLAKTVVGGSAPYIANIIGSSGLDDAGKVMAHAAVSAALVAAQGNSALAGATGAATAEMAGMIALQVYGKSAGELSESEKQTVNALATLAAGLAGGLSGDSMADLVAGSQAGQTTVSNNLFGGNEESQTKFVQEHGKDVLSCADAPSSASCQRGEAVNKAIAVALGAGAAGGAIAATTPELIAATQAAVSACSSNPVLCANEVSIWVAEMAAGDALPAGLTVATVSKISASELSELKALMTVEKQTGSKVSKESVESIVSAKSASGAENVATYPKLKDELVQQNLNNIASQDARLAAAVKGDNG